MSETKCADQLTLFSVGKQQVTVDFQGGQIVTDAGLLPLAQLVEGLGILDDLGRRFPDPRCQENGHPRREGNPRTANLSVPGRLLRFQ